MKRSVFLSCLFLLLISLELVYSMHWATDTQLLDLEYNGAEFVNEASQWSCTSLQLANSKTYNCNGVYYVGGFSIMAANLNNYFQRIYYTLPTHNQVKISFTLFAMDGWENPDRFDINIDGILIPGFVFDTTVTMPAYTSAVCGGANNDYPPFTAIFTYPHSSTTSLTIRMIANLNEATTDESISFRDIVIDFQTVTTPTSSKCAISSKPLYTSSYACACPLTNQYQNPVNSGTCSFCDSTCATCSGSAATQCLTCYPNTDRYLSGTQCLSCYTGCATCTGGGSTDCTSCKSGYYLANNGACYSTCNFPLYTLGDTGSSPLLPNRCLSPCTSASAPYLYWDGTCQSTCTSPLVPTTTNSYTTCFYPCLESQYLAWNGTCLPSCPYPLKIRVQNQRYFCDFPCANSGDFLFWDGTCSSTCASALIPLLEITEGGLQPRKYCRFQCTPSQYLYWNGSCLDACPLPLTSRITNGRLFCDFTCINTNYYLYWNGSCVSSCNSPLSIRTEGTPMRKYCDKPCGGSTDYLYWNGTCSTCLSPLKARVESENRFCDFPCATGEFLYWDGSCKSSCDAPLVQDIQGSVITRKFCQYYCDTTQYLHWNGSCISQCEYPFGKRYTNSRKFCDSPCQATDFFYWNQSCLPSCPLPFSTRIDNNKKYCDYPCTSNSNYLYWNTTCGPCDPPLVKTVVADNNYCDYPCATGEWLYWDNTCNVSCPSPPLSPTIQGTPARQICDYQCDINQFLYWNGTCADYCNYPLLSVTDKGRNFCFYPCLENEFLYPNRICAASCTAIFPTRTEASRNYCDYPCTNNMILAYNGTCWDHCPSPYILNVYNGLKFCELPCPVNEYYMTDSKDCSETCENVFHKADETGPYKKCDAYISTAGLIEIKAQEESVRFLTLARQMNYMRYLDIGMPERLDKLAASHRRGIFATNFGLEMKSTGNFDFFQEKYPYIYARIADVESGLWVSYWQDLISLLIGIGAAIFLFILEKISLGEGWEMVELVSRRIRMIMMWNYVLIVFAWSADNLILFVAMSAMTLSKQKEAPALTPVSLLLAGLCLCLLIGFIYSTFKLIQKRRNLMRVNGNLKKAENLKQFDRQYEKFQVLYRGFKDNSVLNQMFFLIYMLRMALPMVIAIIGVKSPVAVSVCQLLINLAMLAFLLIMKPFKKVIYQIQLVSCETIIFMMNICVIALAAAGDPKESTSSIRLGNVVIVGNYMINGLQVVFLVIKIWIEGKIMYQNMRGYDQILMKEKVIMYFQLFTLVIQQDNIGFEEMVSPPPYIFTKRKLPPKPSLPKNKNKVYEQKIPNVNEKEYESGATTGTGEGKFFTRDFSTMHLETYREDYVIESDRALSIFHSQRTPVFQQDNEIIIAERSRPVDLKKTHKEVEILLEKAKSVLHKKEAKNEEVSPKINRKKRMTSLFAKETNDDFLAENEIILEEESNSYLSVKEIGNDGFLPENEITLEEAKPSFSNNPEQAKKLNFGRKKRILNKFDIQLEKSDFPNNEI